MTSAQLGLIPSCKHPVVPGDPPGAAGFQSGHHWGPPWASTESPVMVTGGPRQGSVGRTLSASRSEPTAKRTDPVDFLSRGLSVPLSRPTCPSKCATQSRVSGHKADGSSHSRGVSPCLGAPHRTQELREGGRHAQGHTGKQQLGACSPAWSAGPLTASRQTHPLCSD